MPEDSDQQQPIIIKKIYVAHGGYHGGSWKVAFADFMTAMMAFFLVLWLVGQDQEIKESIKNFENIAIVEIAEIKTAKVVIFDKRMLKFKIGDNITVSGELKDYKGSKEVIAEKIRKNS